MADSSKPQTASNKNSLNSHGSLLGRPAEWLTMLAGKIDLRFLLLGALLPDIIDKPLGYIFFREALSSGRTAAHSLLFLLGLALAGWLVYLLQHGTWLLVVSAGSLAHLTLDQMWRMPQTLFWPFLGTTFDKHNLSNYVANIFISLTTNPSAYIPEIIGGLILAWFDWKILKRHRLEAFVKYGIL